MPQPYSPFTAWQAHDVLMLLRVAEMRLDWMWEIDKPTLPTFTQLSSLFGDRELPPGFEECSLVKLESVTRVYANVLSLKRYQHTEFNQMFPACRQYDGRNSLLLKIKGVNYYMYLWAILDSENRHIFCQYLEAYQTKLI